MLPTGLKLRLGTAEVPGGINPKIRKALWLDFQLKLLEQNE